MALFQAAAISRRYSNDLPRARLFQSFLKQWLDDLHTVHPHTAEDNRKPLVHGAFHLYDFLLLFGPFVWWWAFAFERQVLTFQNIPTNQLIGGVLESTLFRSFTQGANLRRWLGRSDCPTSYRFIADLLERVYSRRSADLDDEDVSELPTGERAHINYKGVHYSRASTHEGNSHIRYYSFGIEGSVVGSIKTITVQDGEIVLNISRLLPLPRVQLDPFVPYPHIQAKCYSSLFATGLDHVLVKDVLGHVAKYDFSHERCVVINLSWVSFILSFSRSQAD